MKFLRILSISLLALGFSGCDQLQEVVNQLPSEGPPTTFEIQTGLKEALRLGIDRKVSELAVEDGFFKNPLVRIELPADLQTVDRALRRIGLSSLADDGLRYLNRAAEDAVQEGIPIVVDAVSGITVDDARSILLGENDAATRYLEQKTSEALYHKFNPLIANSMQRVGADRVWAEIIGTYNELPLVNRVNPDLAAYVTGEALEGVYTSIAQEEKEIRTKFSSRTTRLLQRVFALQD